MASSGEVDEDVEETFLYGVCFGLSDMPVPDPLWYHLEGGDAAEKSHISCNIQLFVWIGIQGMDVTS
ncbi:hypothetical protein NL676_011964 [Syzygium grande]|nr:hypothetical protein NL676_011964 [Syzygium grande]